MDFFSHEVIDSTSDEARRLLDANRVAEIACVVARAQTKGRGTHGRPWVSPRDGGIYLTVVRRVDREIQLDPQRITPALGHACAEVLCRASGAEIVLRGANDLYVDGCKLGGLLTEAITSGRRLESMLVGLGVNVASGAVRLPEDDPVRPIALADIAPDRDWSPAACDELVRELSSTIAAVIASVIREPGGTDSA
jgi:BirA family biotin operon repressor/biotin-[acetyl-CoA-carboxylase] ligase